MVEVLMTHPRRQRDALQILFAVFLGLMVATFVGMGVYTFYPSGLEAIEDQASDLRREQQNLRLGRADSELSGEQRARLDEVEAQLRQVDATRRDRQETWARNSSILLVLLSTLVMGISLIRAEQLPVISNGLLLGGVFTMIYGTGWTFASGESQLRFWVTAFALMVTLGLGYVRFVRVRRATAAPVETSTSTSAALQEIEARIGRIEDQLDNVGRALRDPDA
jgi:hypothetical protein